MGRDRHRHQDGAGCLSATPTANLFDRRKKSYESAIEEIKNRTEWGPLEANNPSMAATLLSPLQGRIGTDEDKEAVTRRHIARQVQSDRNGIGPCRRRWAEVVGLGQVARTVDRQREERHRSERCGCPSSSIGPFRRKRNSTKPSTSYGIHFRSASMKAQSSFWSEQCSVPDKSLKTTSGLRTCS